MPGRALALEVFHGRLLALLLLLIPPNGTVRSSPPDALAGLVPQGEQLGKRPQVTEP
jgi:hypothetical protein